MGVTASLTLSFTIFMMCQMYFAHSQIPFLGGSSRYGVGGCPKVTPMTNFDVTKTYGGKWYYMAHYSDVTLDGYHCTQLTVSDGNPGKDICRMLINRTSVKYDSGDIQSVPYSLTLLNEVNQGVWMDIVYGGATRKGYIIDTDYDEYVLYHDCNEYPRDNPVFHEQNNIIFSRKPVWPGGFTPREKVLKIFESFGIDSRPFVWVNQTDCPFQIA